MSVGLVKWIGIYSQKFDRNHGSNLQFYEESILTLTIKGKFLGVTVSGPVAMVIFLTIDQIPGVFPCTH